MRNGNNCSQMKKQASKTHSFLSYLWGMETSFPSLLYSFPLLRSYPTYEEWKPIFLKILKFKVKFLSYLWGMETMFTPESVDTSILFLSYLWGMETDSSILIQQSLKNVLILPMRNGNLIAILITLAEYLGSYPTYEEWKPLFVNPLMKLIRCSFLSYLWGMETNWQNEPRSST